MMVRAEIDVKAPVERVFDLFTDFKNIEKNVEGIQKIEFLEKDGEPVLGMKWRETRKMFGKEATEVMWITEINDNKNYVVEAESHGMHYRSEYIFTEENGGTKVSLTFGGEPQTLMAKMMGFMGFFMAGSIKKMLLKDIEDLKRVLDR